MTRDWAIALLTFASARRRAEVAGLKVEDFELSGPASSP
jgi:hypothetical protein